MGSFLESFGSRVNMAWFVSEAMLRLAMAALLGGLIGLERGVKQKPAGLRTNMFICFGSAMFTILSDSLARTWGGDHTRIAAQIIPGIGFIGAGSILHARRGVTGLTTAATIFVVASIGMAAGGGLYLPAIFATILLLLSLHFLGWVETRFNLKPVTTTYEVHGKNAEEMMTVVNGVLEDEQRMMQTVQIARADSHYRVQFTVEAMRHDHEKLLNRLRQKPELTQVRYDNPDLDLE
jgi:putative Mg2+ transporter-C (MgtC) family protein